MELNAMQLALYISSLESENERLRASNQALTEQRDRLIRMEQKAIERMLEYEAQSENVMKMIEG